MRRVVALLFALVAVPLWAASPRISFWRTIPAQHDVGGGEIAIVSARGERPLVDLFLDRLVAEVGDGPSLRLRDAAERLPPGSSSATSASRTKQPAPVRPSLALADLTCSTTDMQGDASTHDIDGRRIWRRMHWVQATCTARIDILNAGGKPHDSFAVRGEGTSTRRPAPDDDLKASAIGSAIRYAARAAAESIAPRRVREWIILDESSPAFDEGMTMIDISQPERARATWEAALRKNNASAALRFNLGAVCEALGDIKAASEHYRAAVRMRAEEPRYAVEFEAFRRRQGLTGRR